MPDSERSRKKLVPGSGRTSTVPRPPVTGGHLPLPSLCPLFLVSRLLGLRRMFRSRLGSRFSGLLVSFDGRRFNLRTRFRFRRRRGHRSRDHRRRNRTLPLALCHLTFLAGRGGNGRSRRCFRPAPAPRWRRRRRRGRRKRFQKLQSLRPRTQLSVEQQHEHVARNLWIFRQRRRDQ